tara:strand:- start:1554 stop:2447 length:894 start_codon:yes stop_codon:yes gene_type:complete
MKICIFGGNGFIGSNLAMEYIKRKHNVFIYSQTKINKSIKIKNNFKIKYNENNFTKILSKKFDLIFFLSGNSHQESSKKDIYHDLETTFTTFIQLLEAVRKNKFKPTIWFASSVVVYGINNKPLKENFDRKPVSYYAVTKYLCENAINFYSNNFNINVGIMRIFSTFGPGLKRQVIFDTIKKIKTKNKFQMIGSGKEKRDFGYIDDQIKSIILLSKKVKKPKGDIYNIASGKAFSIKDIVNRLVKISKKKVIYTFTKKRRSFDNKNYIADKSKLNRTIGCIKYTDINVALKKTFESY